MKFIKKNSKAQTMTEYLILVCLLGAGSVFVVQTFGNIVRTQISKAGREIAGSPGSDIDKASDEANKLDNRAVKKTLDDFANDKSNSSRSNRR